MFTASGFRKWFRLSFEWEIFRSSFFGLKESFSWKQVASDCPTPKVQGIAPDAAYSRSCGCDLPWKIVDYVICMQEMLYVPELGATVAIVSTNAMIINISSENNDHL
jgi:hypothetical protein